MSLKKTITILKLVYFIFKLSIQTSDFWIAFNKSILVYISSVIAIVWFLNYNIYFANHLKMYFVKLSFWHEFDSVFQTLCIKYDMFELVINDFSKCLLFKFSDDQAQTLSWSVNSYSINLLFLRKLIRS